MTMYGLGYLRQALKTLDHVWCRMQVMKDRHPCYRRQTTALLQLLAGWHLTRLKVGHVTGFYSLQALHAAWFWPSVPCTL